MRSLFTGLGCLLCLTGLASADLLVQQNFGTLGANASFPMSGNFDGLPNNAQFYSVPDPSFAGPYLHEFVGQFMTTVRSRFIISGVGGHVFFLNSLNVDTGGTATGGIDTRFGTDRGVFGPGNYFVSVADTGDDPPPGVLDYARGISVFQSFDQRVTTTGTLVAGGPTAQRPTDFGTYDPDPRQSRYAVIPFWTEAGGPLIAGNGDSVGYYGINLTSDVPLQYFLFTDASPFDPAHVFVDSASQIGGMGDTLKQLVNLKQYYLVAMTLDDTSTLPPSVGFSLNIGDGSTVVRPGTVPEPGTTMMVAACGALALRRRRPSALKVP